MSICHKYLFSFLLCLLTGLSGIAQPIYYPKYIPYRKGDKWGFCDKNKQILISPQYSKTRFFKPFNDTQSGSVVFKGNKAGLIDTQNQLLVPFKYSNITILAQGYLALHKKNKMALSHCKRGRLTKFQYQYISPEPFVNKNNQDTLFLVKKNGQTGVINQQGKLIIKPQYTSIVDYAHLRSDQQKIRFFIVSKNGKYGICDYHNKRLIPFEYDSLAFLGTRANTFKAKKGNKVGVIDIKNQKILDFKFRELEFWRTTYRYYVEKDGKVAQFTRSGKQATPYKKGRIEQEEEILIYSGATNWVVVKSKNKRYALVNSKTQKNITPYKYLHLKNLHKYGTHLFKVTLPDKKWGYIAHDGTEYFD